MPSKIPFKFTLKVRMQSSKHCETVRYGTASSILSTSIQLRPFIFDSFRLIRSGMRNGHSAQRSAARDRAFAKSATQRIDCCLRGGAPWRNDIGEVALVRGRAGDKRRCADSNQAKVNSGCFFYQQRAGQLEQAIGQHCRAGEAGRTRSRCKPRCFQFQYDTAGGKSVLLQPASQFFAQAPEVWFQVRDRGQVAIEGLLRADGLR